MSRPYPCSPKCWNTLTELIQAHPYHFPLQNEHASRTKWLLHGLALIVYPVCLLVLTLLVILAFVLDVCCIGSLFVVLMMLMFSVPITVSVMAYHVWKNNGDKQSGVFAWYIIMVVCLTGKTVELFCLPVVTLAPLRLVEYGRLVCQGREHAEYLWHRMLHRQEQVHFIIAICIETLLLLLACLGMGLGVACLKHNRNMVRDPKLMIAASGVPLALWVLGFFLSLLCDSRFSDRYIFIL